MLNLPISAFYSVHVDGNFFRKITLNIIYPLKLIIRGFYLHTVFAINYSFIFQRPKFNYCLGIEKLLLLPVKIPGLIMNKDLFFLIQTSHRWIRPKGRKCLKCVLFPVQKHWDQSRCQNCLGGRRVTLSTGPDQLFTLDLVWENCGSLF